MDVYREKDLQWAPHVAKDVERKIFISKKENQVDVTCMLVRIAKGAEIPEHVHDTQHDIVYVLQGKFKFWVDGVDYDAEKGTLVRVPPGIKHRLYDVQEEVIYYDVFVPPTL